MALPSASIALVWFTANHLILKTTHDVGTIIIPILKVKKQEQGK